MIEPRTVTPEVAGPSPVAPASKWLQIAEVVIAVQRKSGHRWSPFFSQRVGRHSPDLQGLRPQRAPVCGLPKSLGPGSRLAMARARELRAETDTTSIVGVRDSCCALADRYEAAAATRLPAR